MTTLESAAEALIRTQAAVLGSLDSAHGLLQSQVAAQTAYAKREHEKHLSIARNQAAQAVTEHSLTARDAAPLGAIPTLNPLNAADYIRLGTLRLPGVDAGVNADVFAPFVLPLMGHGNIIVDAPIGSGIPLVQQVVWEALSRTAPGQLDLIVFDPSLTAALSPFAGIRSVSEETLAVMSRPVELEQALTHLTSDIQRVNDMLRGVNGTLLDFRAQAGHPVERLKLVILLDYPNGVEEDLNRQLIALTKVGPAAGISFLILADAQKPAPGWWSQDDIENAHFIATKRKVLRWAAHPAFEIEPNLPDQVSLVRSIDELTALMSSASVPAVAFDRIQPAAERWHRSSRDGISFAVGLSGSEVVEITLGSEREQRHNALITGAVGQGKSNLLKIIIHSLGQRYSPDELEFYLLDFKEGVTLYPFAPTPDSPDFLPHARVLGLESDRDFGLAVLRHVEAEFAKRAKLFRPYGDNIAKYRAAVPEARMPRIVLMIDEFQVLLDASDNKAEEAAQLLEALARRGRSYGVHIILASQTISGIAALMTRENGIFAQFPIRLALKNALTESYATLSQGNNAAARLRMRGEAIINLDYGASIANRKAVIAVADDQELERIRIGWWNDARSTSAAPVVFDGGKLVRPAAAVESIRDLRRRVIARGSAPAAVIGFPIEVSGEPLAITFSAEPGRNLAILGAGEKTGRLIADDETANNAIGVLQAATISLALQHPRGDAEFVSLDLLEESTAARNGHKEWVNLMERLGFPLWQIKKPDIPGFMQKAAEQLATRGEGEPARYIVGFGLDRANNLDTPDTFSHRPAEDFQTVLRDGPSKSVHVIGWWSNAASFKSHIGYGGEGFVDSLLMLRLDQAGVQEFLGPFVTWSVRDNRGLLTDRTQLTEPTMIIPFAPLNARDTAILSNTEWET